MLYGQMARASAIDEQLRVCGKTGDAIWQALLEPVARASRKRVECEQWA